MEPGRMFGKQGPAAARLLVSAAAGLLATVATFLAHGAEYAPAAGWFVAAAVFGIWTFFVVLVLLFVIGVRKRNGLWTTQQPWISGNMSAGPPPVQQPVYSEYGVPPPQVQQYHYPQYAAPPPQAQGWYMQQPQQPFEAPAYSQPRELEQPLHVHEMK